MKATRDDIVHAYRLLLGREPDDQGLQHFLGILEARSISTRELTALFMDSGEYREEAPKSVVSSVERPAAGRLICTACTQAGLESSTFRDWAQQLRERPGHLHRKVWEWCFISQALFERDMLTDGRAGLGFAVGREPLTAKFAAMGCRVVATDLDFEKADQEGWVDGLQHAANLDALNDRELCDKELFKQRVAFQSADMRAISPDLQGFDFLWSSCALEHLGSLEEGMSFVIESLKCLRPGGVAVHTTEINVDSDVDTIKTGHDVIYRKSDFLKLAERLAGLGHHIEPFDFDFGNQEADRIVDEPPYTGMPHLKLRIGRFASTSFGLIVTKGVA